MKLTLKWVVWFSAIGVYVMLLGGVFYYNLFKLTFDEKLKQDILEAARLKSPEMIKGLLRSPRVITFEEFDVMNWLRSDKRITEVVYLNANGTIRWHPQGQYIGMQFEDYEKTVGVLTDAIGQAYYSGNPKVRAVPKQPFYDIAIPLKAKGEVVIGILSLQVSREGADKIIKSAMRKYVLGAVGVLILLGIPLYIFLSHYVLGPLGSLRDNIDGVSAKSLNMKFPPRKDEIGEVADSLNGLLEKVRLEIDTLSEREKQRQGYEQSWWLAVLGTAVPRAAKALVVDEDNSVLFANFELNKPDPTQKLHLLDIVDSRQQDVLRLIGMAMDNPRQTMEGDTIFKGETAHVKVVQMHSETNMRRTLILFEPRPSV